MNTAPGIPDFVLEQHRLGELPPDESSEVEKRLSDDTELRTRVSDLAASDQDLLRAHPAEEFIVSVRRRLATAENAPRGRRAPVWLVAATSSAFVVMAAFLLNRSEVGGVGSGRPLSESTEGDRLKGSGPVLQVFMLGKGALESGAAAHAGDVVQLAYQGSGNRFGVIVSIDGRGQVTRHFPLEGSAAAPLRIGGAVSLNAAYRLDDAPRAERFYFVAAREPFLIDAIEGAAREAASDPVTNVRLALPPNFAQASFLLKKE